MAVVLLQVTMTGSAQQISTQNIAIKAIHFQNNAAAAMRVGDSTVTASKGINLANGGGSFGPNTADMIPFSYLSDWWVIGTATQLLDVLYVT